MTAQDPHSWVLRPGTPVAAFTALARAEGWTLTSDAPRAHNATAYQVWSGEEGTVELVLDHVHGLRVLASVPYGPVLREKLPLIDVDELFADAAADEPLQRIRALYALLHMQINAAMNAAPTFPIDPESPEHRLIEDDTRFLDAFTTALTDPEPGVRRAAVEGLTASLYPGALPILREWRDRLPELQGKIDWAFNRGPTRITAA